MSLICVSWAEYVSSGLATAGAGVAGAGVPDALDGGTAAHGFAPAPPGAEPSNDEKSSPPAAGGAAG